MRTARTKRACDICGHTCTLTRRQHECYKRIPATIKPVWHASFDEPRAKGAYFGTEATPIKAPAWRLFPEVPGEARRLPRRTVLSKADEAQLFLRYNYARFRLSRLADKQRARTTKSRAVAMLEWHDRTQEIREKLVSANMSLVVTMAKRARIPSVTFPELVSEGYVAMLRAIESFDVSRGYKFSTYACRAILKGFNRMATKVGRYNSRFGISYDPAMEPSDYDVHKHQMQRALAVDDLRDAIAGNQAELNETERRVVTERFGLGRRPNAKTLAQVGRMVGLSNERVRQVQKQALAKIRQVLDERYLTVS